VDLATFYPTQLLVTGFDILFFWVARMIMLSTHFMLEQPMTDGSARSLADAVPFREVYIHALVRDADRQKMSKTKGNVIDPIGIVQKFGTDAVRFTLAAMASPGTDIAFNEARTEGYRAFANKIWNAARFIFMNVDRAAEAGMIVDMRTVFDAPGSSELEARWISSRLSATVSEVNAALAEYRFHEAASVVYQFFWGDFCDWYLEIVKLRLDFTEAANTSATAAALITLLATFESALRLLSPFMPFLTEELWHAVYDGAPPAKSIALSTFPRPGTLDSSAEKEMALLQELITTIRVARKDLTMPEKLPADTRIHPSAQHFDLDKHALILQKLAFVSAISTHAIDPALPRKTTANFDVQVLFERVIDPEIESARLTKEIDQLQKAIDNAQRQLTNDNFLSRAPAQVVEAMRSQQAQNISLVEKKRADLDGLTLKR
jgi:valyl-tRNA synthetase